MDPFTASLPEVLREHSSVVKELLREHSLAAYRSGRSIIAEETDDAVGQYLNGFGTCNDEILDVLKGLKRIVGRMTKEAQNAATPDTQFVEIYKHHDEELARIEVECGDFREKFNDARAYISTLKHITAFPEWTVPVDLQELVRDVITYTDKPLKAADIEHTFNSNGSIFMALCPPKLGRVVKGMITGCITNLAEAVHPRQIELNLVRTAQGVTITVEDNGPALAAEKKKKMLGNSGQHSATHSFYHYSIVINKMKGTLLPLAQGKLGGLGLVITLPLNLILNETNS